MVPAIYKTLDDIQRILAWFFPGAHPDSDGAAEARLADGAVGSDNGPTMEDGVFSEGTTTSSRGYEPGGGSS